MPSAPLWTSKETLSQSRTIGFSKAGPTSICFEQQPHQSGVKHMLWIMGWLMMLN